MIKYLCCSKLRLQYNEFTIITAYNAEYDAICVKMFYLQFYLAATAIHIQSVRSQICVHTPPPPHTHTQLFTT